MAFKSETARNGAPARSIDLSWDNPEIDQAAKPKRDVKKLFLVVGLGVLSWVATYVGMLELIEANMGELPLVHKIIIGFSVAMLMTMIVWLLDQMFAEIGFFTRVIYAAGYVFLSIISIGFGFGFYWKVLESRGEASRSAESAVGQVQNSLHAAMTRLEQLQGTLDSLTAISTQKADNERNTGTSCIGSKPGDGPRRQMRDADAARFKFASDFVKGRVGTVRTDIAALEGDLGRIARDDKSIVDKSGTRNEFMRNLGRKLDLTVTGFNAFRTDPQLRQIRIDLNERADKVTFVDTKGGTYTCPDGQLTTALKGVVRAIDELPALEKPKIATVEGSEAVIEAFRRLTATFYGALSFKLPPSPEELRELQKKTVQSVEAAPAAQARLNAMAEAGLSKRDYVPLAIAVFVDLCLLFVSMGRPRNRLQGLVPKMREAERGPVIQILSRFNEIHRDAEIRENFEMFRHVVFDFHGDYYAAIPLNAPYRPNLHNGRQRQGYGVSDAQELLQEAHLLGNLFASFEKEKIFTRVHSPLLSTKTVQKRLRRQGSKFANSEAFRLYRFKDGAWSEIILGAVMGAARRVEAEKRRRRVEEDVFRSSEPTLEARDREREDDRRLRRERESLEERDRAAADDALKNARPHAYPQGAPVNGHPYGVQSGQPGARMPYRPGGQPYPAVVNGHGGGDHNGYPAPGHAPHAEPHAAPMTGTHGAVAWNANGPYVGPAGAPRSQMPSATPFYPAQPSGYPAQPSGPLAQPPHQLRTPHATRQPSPDIDAPFANNNTQPSSRARLPIETQLPSDMGAAENIVLHPAMSRPQPVAQPVPEAATPAVPLEPIIVMPETAEKMVTVEAVRETMTYKVPVSEAALPQSLLRPAAEPAAVTVEATSVGTLSALPPPLPEAFFAKPAASVDVIALPEAAAERAVRAERSSWERVDQTGWRAAHDSALVGQGFETDDTRTMALRLRPTKREG